MDRVRQTSSGATDDALSLTLQERRVETQPIPATTSLLGLPVELQNAILEYVRSMHAVR